MIFAKRDRCVALSNPTLALCASFAMVLIGASPAFAALQISSGQTMNVDCSGGVCSATSTDAVLNVGELANMLSSSDVTVASGNLARVIEIDASVSWTSTKRLVLDSYYSIAFNKPVVVAGTGALTITTNDGGQGGDFRFFKKGHVEFWDLDSNLVVNGQSYILENKLKHLVSDIRHAPHSNYALAKNIGAGMRLYTESPVGAVSGILEGLGNKISGLKITSSVDRATVAFVGQLTSQATLHNIGVVDVSVSGSGVEQCAGALVGVNEGTVANVYATGEIIATGAQSTVGGLVCSNQFGTVTRSESDVTISGGSDATVGGLAGLSLGFDNSDGFVMESYARGAATGGANAMVGGLVGNNWGGSIWNSYATGRVTGGASAAVGGLVGGNLDNPGEGSIPVVNSSYSTGVVTGGTSATVGGLIGQDAADSQITSAYWDLDASGINDPHQGAGNIADDPGITGLTTEQFKSGLPAGFSPAIWKEKANINNGYPYLIDLPPN